MRNFVKGTLRGGKADTLQRAFAKMLKSFERQREMRAAFGGRQSMNLVDHHGFDGAKRIASVRSKQQVQRFRRGDENVRGMAQKFGSFGGRSITRADGHGGKMKLGAGALCGMADADEW